jgi:Fe-S cluster biosynthesis and repair protein YggX
MVHCVKLNQDLEGLPRPPFNGELAKRIFESVSKDAWKMWLEHAKMIINEYRLNMASGEAQSLLMHEMEKYFFGEGSAPPPDFKPEGH